MKRIFAVFLFFIFQTANAQSVYSFAGLNWGATPEQVNQTLKQKGFTGIPFLTQKKCVLTSECVVDFDGPSVINGYAFFYAGKLDRVAVTTSKNSGLEKVLVEKYGLPQHLPRNPNSSENVLDMIEADKNKWWRAPNGEGLKLYLDNQIDYLSKRAMDSFHQKPQLQKSNF